MTLITLNLLKTPLTKQFLLIIVLFLASLWIVLPEKQQPIGKRHQDLIAHQLITYNLWNQFGFSHYHGGLILTYPNPGDLHLKADPLQTAKNSKGEFFYCSYPPFTFYSTYFILKIFHLPIDEFSIYSIASFFLFLNIIALFLIFKEYAFLPITSYLFLPNVLWFHHNVWFVDIQVITFILWAFYFSMKSLTGFLICIFGACFTEWWGILFALSFLFYLKFLNYKKNSFNILPIGKAIVNNPYYPILILITVASAFSLFLTINILSTGTEFFSGIYERFIVRFGIDNQQKDYFSRFQLKTYIFITWYYLRNYLPITSLITTLYLWFSFKNHKNLINFLFTLSPLWLSIFLHHLILINWTAVHDFSVLKSSILIPFGVFFIIKIIPPHKKWILFINFAIFISSQIYLYFKHSNVERNTHYQKIASCIKTHYKLNEVAKANYFNQPITYLWWKAERNVVRDSMVYQCK